MLGIILFSLNLSCLIDEDYIITYPTYELAEMQAYTDWIDNQEFIIRLDWEAPGLTPFRESLQSAGKAYSWMKFKIERDNQIWETENFNDHSYFLYYPLHDFFCKEITSLASGENPHIWAITPNSGIVLRNRATGGLIDFDLQKGDKVWINVDCYAVEDGSYVGRRIKTARRFINGVGGNMPDAVGFYWPANKATTIANRELNDFSTETGGPYDFKFCLKNTSPIESAFDIKLYSYYGDYGLNGKLEGMVRTGVIPPGFQCCNIVMSVTGLYSQNGYFDLHFESVDDPTYYGQSDRIYFGAWARLDDNANKATYDVDMYYTYANGNDYIFPYMPNEEEINRPFRVFNKKLSFCDPDNYGEFNWDQWNSILDSPYLEVTGYDSAFVNPLPIFDYSKFAFIDSQITTLDLADLYRLYFDGLKTHMLISSSPNCISCIPLKTILNYDKVPSIQGATYGNIILLVTEFAPNYHIAPLTLLIHEFGHARPFLGLSDRPPNSHDYAHPACVMSQGYFVKGSVYNNPEYDTYYHFTNVNPHFCSWCIDAVQ